MSDVPNPPLTFGTPALAVGAAPSRDNGPLVIAVMIVGALVALPALLGLLGSASISFGASKGGTTFGALIDIAYVILGVGLMLRRELARQVYVVLVVISLILLTVSAVGALASNNIGRTGSAAQQVNAVIATEQADRGTSVAEKQRNIASMRRGLAKLEANEHPGLTGTSGLIPGFLLAFIGLVFFTRPAVKEVFLE
jgi:uncharacterized membrane protein